MCLHKKKTFQIFVVLDTYPSCRTVRPIREGICTRTTCCPCRSHSALCFGTWIRYKVLVCYTSLRWIPFNNETKRMNTCGFRDDTDACETRTKRSNVVQLSCVRYTVVPINSLPEDNGSVASCPCPTNSCRRGGTGLRRTAFHHSRRCSGPRRLTNGPTV